MPRLRYTLRGDGKEITKTINEETEKRVNDFLADPASYKEESLVLDDGKQKSRIRIDAIISIEVLPDKERRGMLRGETGGFV